MPKRLRIWALQPLGRWGGASCKAPPQVRLKPLPYRRVRLSVERSAAHRELGVPLFGWRVRVVETKPRHRALQLCTSTVFDEMIGHICI